MNHVKNKQVMDLLRHLFNKRKIGGNHTEERNVLKRINHLPRDEQNAVLEAWQDCVKQELVLCKKSTGEVHVSLNPRKIKEILCLIEEQEKE